MSELNFSAAERYDHTVTIPMNNDPTTRLTIRDGGSAVLEHAYYDITYHNGKEIEEISWHPAFPQPGKEILTSMMKEYESYVENEVCLPNEVR